MSYNVYIKYVKIGYHLAGRLSKDTRALTPVEINFNKILSHVRIIIEHTFGLLKKNFDNISIKLNEHGCYCHLIRASCVLHNLSLRMRTWTGNNLKMKLAEQT